MDDVIPVMIMLILFFAVLYLVYKIIVFSANRLVESNLRKEIIDGDIGEKGISVKLKVKDWFNWNIQTNNEKGTAGGNIKINFPVKYAAVICFTLCIATATIPVTKWLVPGIMFSFGVYYLMKWWRALQIVKTIDDWYKHTAIYALTQRRLYRSPSGHILGGVCTGISEFTGIRVGVTRTIVVIVSVVTYGTGAVAYCLMWLLVPAKS